MHLLIAGSDDRVNGDYFNLGGAQPVALEEFVKLLLKAAGRRLLPHRSVPSGKESHRYRKCLQLRREIQRSDWLEGACADRRRFAADSSNITAAIARTTGNPASMQTQDFELLYRLEEKYWWFVAMREITDTIAARELQQAGLRILDAGCGTGFNLGLLLGKTAQGTSTASTLPTQLLSTRSQAWLSQNCPGFDKRDSVRSETLRYRVFIRSRDADAARACTMQHCGKCIAC